MSRLTVTSGGVSQTMGNSTNEKKGRVIRVTPTCSTTAYSDGDVFFNATEIPDAVRVRGGSAIIKNISVINYDDETSEMELLFHQTGGINLGTLNTQPDITDANVKNLNIIAHHLMAAGDWMPFNSSADSSATVYTSGASQADNNRNILISASENSTSIYVSAMATDSTNLGNATDIELIFCIEYLD